MGHKGSQNLIWLIVIVVVVLIIIGLVMNRNDSTITETERKNRQNNLVGALIIGGIIVLGLWWFMGSDKHHGHHGHHGHHKSESMNEEERPVSRSLSPPSGSSPSLRSGQTASGPRSAGLQARSARSPPRGSLSSLSPSRGE
jgi:hypothetical protein